MEKEIKEIVNKIPDDIEFIPDMDLFVNTLYKVNQSGDVTQAYNTLLDILNNDDGKTNNIEGTGKITFKYIIIKYAAYIDWWTFTYDGYDEKFIPKKDKLKNPYDYLFEDAYNQIFKLKNNSLTNYLFGGFSIDTLERKLKIFKQLIGEPDGEIKTDKVEPQQESYRSSSTDVNSDIF